MDGWEVETFQVANAQLLEQAARSSKDLPPTILMLQDERPAP